MYKLKQELTTLNQKTLQKTLLHFINDKLKISNVLAYKLTLKLSAGRF